MESAACCQQTGGQPASVSFAFAAICDSCIFKSKPGSNAFENIKILLYCIVQERYVIIIENQLYIEVTEMRSRNRIFAGVLAVCLAGLLTACEQKANLADGITEQNLEAVKEAAEAGADLNHMRIVSLLPAEKNPLKKAITDQNWPIIRYLTEAGADLNAADSQGITPLMYAAGAGYDHCGFLDSFSADLEIVKFLTEQGADLCLTDRNGYSALDYAIRHAEYDQVSEIAEYLLESGSAVTDQTMELALEASAKGCFQYLLLRQTAEKRLEQGKDTGLEPLLEAVVRGKQNEAKQLLGLIPADSNERGRLLACAAAFGDPELVELIAEKIHADLDYFWDPAGNSLLMIAAQCGNQEVFDQLFFSESQLWETDGNGDYLAALAIQRGQTFVLQRLFGLYTTEIQEIDNGYFGECLIGAVVRSGDIELMKSLLTAGYPLDDAWSYCIYEAVAADQGSMLDFLIEHRPDSMLYPAYPSQALNISAKRGDLELAEKLITLGIEINGDLSGTPLFYAIKANQLEMVRFLLENQADPNAVSESWEFETGYGDTPLLTAIQCGHLDIIKLLIEHGSEIEREGALRLAKRYSSKRVITYLERLTATI